MQRVGIGQLAGLAIAGAIQLPVTAAAARQVEPRTRGPVVVRVDDGFRWLDALIGAVTTLAVVLLVVGFVFSARKSLSPRTKGER
jgi:hypothetical protein